jgi:hypothetical protein
LNGFQQLFTLPDTVIVGEDDLDVRTQALRGLLGGRCLEALIVVVLCNQRNQKAELIHEALLTAVGPYDLLATRILASSGNTPSLIFWHPWALQQSYDGKCIKEQIGTLPAIVESADSKVRALTYEIVDKLPALKPHESRIA